MSGTKNDNLRRAWRPIVIALALLSSLGAALGQSDGLSDYGAAMCAEAGIAPDDCTFASGAEPAAVDAAPVAGGKNATLLSRGRDLCEQQGVPLEDCMALPLAARTAEPGRTAPTPFLSPADRLPAVAVAPVAAPAAAPAIAPSPASSVTAVPRVAPVPIASHAPLAARTAAIPPAPPPPPADFGFREGRAPLPPVDLGFGNVPVRRAQAPIDPAFAPFATAPPFIVDGRDTGIAPAAPGFRPVFPEPESLPPPIGARAPAFRADRLAAPIRGEPPFVIEARDRGGPIVQTDRSFGVDRGVRGGQSRRCFREVHYSGPPSFRYVGCRF